MQHTAHTAQSPDLADFLPFKKFAVEFERQGLGSESSLRWLARFRHANGLIRSGALVEIKTPGHTRARLLVNKRAFAAWLATQNTAA